MFDYLQQFNNLPKNLRDQVSSASAMLLLTELENKYKVDLAMVVMKVMIKNIAISNLVNYFISESGLTRESAQALSSELKEKIFIGVADYLGIMSDIRALDLEKDIKVIISEAGLTLASSELVNRFKNILATYLKGIRAKIDTRAVLGKEVVSGGLNLSPAEIDRVFKVCEAQKFKSLSVSPSPSPMASTLSDKPLISSSSRLDQIINNSEGKLASSGKIADYNLKEMIARGQIKKPELLDLPAGEKKIAAPLKVVPPVVTTPIQNPIPATTPTAAPIPTPTPTPIAQTAAPVKMPISVPKQTINPAPIVPPHPSLARQALTSTPGRPSMHDVKIVPKVMGPIEELQYLDVVNFRRLGTTPNESVIKIFNKIKQLEKEGYDKMVTGVKAWRQSPVNRLYVRIGQEAISKGLTLKEAALEHQKNNPEYLKMEEIEAIVSLNSKLVF